MIIVALSGGPDSLALAVFLAEWRMRDPARGKLAIECVTVDHRLRVESANEAKACAEFSRQLNLPHTTLQWLDDKPASGVANAARDARYRLLTDYAVSRAGGKPVAVVTGHHRDDQAETVLMRLARGSGVAGLAAMAQARQLNHDPRVMLVRPWLGFAKSRLVATVEDRNLTAINDPSNRDLKTERARLRANRNSLDAIGLTSANLARSADRMRDADEALGFAEHVAWRDLGFAVLARDDAKACVFADCGRAQLAALPMLVRVGILARLARQFGGLTPPPRLSELERLAEGCANYARATVTLGGVVFVLGGKRLRAYREVGRITEPPRRLVFGETRTLWDGRFWISAVGPSNVALEVRVLGADGLKTARQTFTDLVDVPAGAAYGVPSFWIDGALVSVPQLAPTESVRRHAAPRGNISIQSDAVALPT